MLLMTREVRKIRNLLKLQTFRDTLREGTHSEEPNVPFSTIRELSLSTTQRLRLETLQSRPEYSNFPKSQLWNSEETLN